MGFWEDVWNNETSKDGPAYASSREIYTDEFIAELAHDFDFDASSNHVLSRLYEIPFRYHLGNRIDHKGEGLKEARKDYERLQKALVTFQQELEKFHGTGIDMELWEGAKALPMFDPDLDARNYPEFVYKSSIAYYFEFFRYLNFLQLGIHKQIGRLKSVGGRPKRFGLSLAVSYISQFWIIDLNRRYSLDYHQGSGISEAFAFTSRLIQQIEPVEERKIVTAMRALIKENARFRDQPKRDASQKPNRKKP